jgi:hypothetical protein
MPGIEQTEPGELCDHRCLKYLDHEGPHWHGYLVNPKAPKELDGEDQLREALADALATHRPRGVRTDDTIKVVVDDMVDEALMPIIRPLLHELGRLEAGRELERTMLRNAATRILELEAALYAAGAGNDG